MKDYNPQKNKLTFQVKNPPRVSSINAQLVFDLFLVIWMDKFINSSVFPVSLAIKNVN
jgi:hypothetical protein